MSSLIASPDIPTPIRPVAGTIFTGSPEAMFDAFGSNPTGIAGAVWPSANRALFVPFEIASPKLAMQLAWYNGSSVSGNVDIGIYDLVGNRLVSSGSTAQSGTSVIQVVNITDTLLVAGLYWLGIAVDNTVGPHLRYNLAVTQQLIAAGMQQMDTAFPLPNPVTFANPAAAYAPCVAVAFQSVM